MKSQNVSGVRPPTSAKLSARLLNVSSVLSVKVSLTRAGYDYGHEQTYDSTSVLLEDDTMNFDDALKAFKPISRDVLERLIEDDIVAEPFSEHDRNFLTALSRLWKDEWYVAQMNKSFTPDKRAIMLAFPDFGKIERYILSSYLNLKPGMKLNVKEMTRRIREHFKLDYPASKIRRVRQIAYNLRRQERGKTRKRFVIQMALLREAGEENVCQKI